MTPSRVKPRSMESALDAIAAAHGEPQYGCNLNGAKADSDLSTGKPGPSKYTLAR